MRVTWVHPSWRDLVIGELAHDAGARRRFLEHCGVDGAALALSTGGARERPLLVDDADWDALGDGLHRLCAELEEPGAVRLLGAIEEALEAAGDPELEALAVLVLERLRRRWGDGPVGVDALAGWLAAAGRLAEPPAAPPLAASWLELMPGGAPQSPEQLERFADWLRLAELLDARDPKLLRETLGFPALHATVLDAFVETSRGVRDEPPVEHELRIEALRRLARLDPSHAKEATGADFELIVQGAEPLEELEEPWEPPAPPAGFDVHRVLRDLVD